jgi:hypothetical protein
LQAGIGDYNVQPDVAASKKKQGFVINYAATRTKPNKKSPRKITGRLSGFSIALLNLKCWF